VTQGEGSRWAVDVEGLGVYRVWTSVSYTTGYCNFVNITFVIKRGQEKSVVNAANAENNE
jgi:uncharacterized protein YutD